MRTTRHSVMITLAVAVVAGGLDSSAHAQCGGPFKLTPSDAAPADCFGYSVAISGDTAIAGTWSDDGERGSAYIYRWDGAAWVQQAKLTASDGVAGDRFGIWVAIDGDTAVVGAYYDDGPGGVDQGSAYVFVRPSGGWRDMTETAKLTASDGAPGELFGVSVAIDGETIVVGAAYNDVGPNGDQGSAYVFVEPVAGWATMTETAKLTAADGASGDYFGDAVAISGDTVLVGAMYGDSKKGAAYVFVEPPGGWTTMTQTARLTAVGGASGDRLGNAVGISGDMAIIGTPVYSGPAGGAQGCAYVFHRTGSLWVQSERTMLASDGAAGDSFGYSVAIDGDTAVVGAWGDDDGRGSAYVYHWDGSAWVQKAKLTASDGATTDHLSSLKVAISGDTVVLGAWGHWSERGAAYVFVMPAGGWTDMTETARLAASDGLSGDWFGFYVGISGDTVVVGAPYWHQSYPRFGSAYVFVKPAGGWSNMTETARLYASDYSGDAMMGASVDVLGDTVVVGAIGDRGSAGSAYIFVKPPGGWVTMTQTGKLWASDGAGSDWLGRSVAIGGDTVVVGAYGDDGPGGADQGSAYVFVKPPSGWANITQTAKLTASDAAANDWFGWSAAIAGDTVVVGAHRHDGTKGVDQGSAYVFLKPPGGWTSMMEAAKLTGSDAAAGDFFGSSVAISGGTVVVGACGDDGPAGADQGSAHSFYIGEECLSYVLNTTAGTKYASIADAIGQAVNGDQILATSGAFPAADDIDYLGKAITLASRRGVSAFYDTIVTLADSSSLAAAAGYDINIYGELRLPSDAMADLAADQLWMTSGSLFHGLTRSSLYCTVPVSLIDGGIQLNNGSLMSFTGSVTCNGPIDVPADAVVDLVTEQLCLGSSATFHGRSRSSLYCTVPVSLLDGTIRLDTSSLMSFTGSATCTGTLNAMSGSTIWADGSLGLNGSSTLFDMSVFAGPISVGGQLNCTNAAFSAPSLGIAGGGRFAGYGTIYADVTNDNRIYTLGDTSIVGDLLNNSGAVITIRVGTMALLGSLTNNGTIIGEIQILGPADASEGADGPVELAGGTQPGDGLVVEGDYVAGAASSLVMSDAVWRVSVGGGYDVAINDNSRYDMAQAELRMTGAAGTAQVLELMSKDIGPSLQGLDRARAGHYPIGTLRIGPTATMVQLVDNHDNDGQGQAASEALYVNALIIDAGATLTTNSCRIYYGSLVNNGSVDDPTHLVPICFVSIPADFDGDCDVDGADLAAFEACATGPAISQADPDCTWARFDADTDVDQSDFAVFQRCYSGENNPADPDCSQ